MSTSISPPKRSARERLLAAADELFYEGGINAVGIDRVIERAGVAKASLYDCFGSKEELIRSYLAARHDARRARVMERLSRHALPKDQLLGIFDGLGELFARPDFRGCAFVRAGSGAADGSSVKGVCAESRAWLRTLFTDLSKAAGAAHPARVAHQLVILYDGASVSAQMDRDAKAATAARAVAAAILEADIAPARKPAPRRKGARGPKATT